MNWRTETTPLVVAADGGVECKAPSDDGGWEPIGVAEGRVVWRQRLWSQEDMKTNERKYALLIEVLELGFERQEEVREELEHYERQVLQKIAELDEKTAKASVRPSETFDAAARRHYQRGYDAALRRARREAATAGAPGATLEGIA